MENIHGEGEETVTEEFRVDPAKNVIFEQKLNMKVNYAYSEVTLFTKRHRCKHHRGREWATEARAEAGKESRRTERMMMVGSTEGVEGGQI